MDTENDRADDGARLTRRDALRATGAAAAGAMAMFAVTSGGTAGAVGASATTWTQSDYASFAKLVAKCWSSPSELKAYNANPTSVLAQYGITLPAGTAAPTIPGKPKGSLGKETTSSKAWDEAATANYENWDVTVSAVASGGGHSTLACIACPWSSFSSMAPSGL